jgi:predicted NAD/FAD-binding protein
VKVAIVGTGISGLTTAFLLAGEHDLTLFEAKDYVGGHTNTVNVALEDQTWSVDTGFIVYNELNYPNFTRLLTKIGVETQPSTMSFSVRCDRTGLEYNGSTMRQLFVQKRNLLRPSFHRMLRDILRFNREATDAVKAGELEATLSDFLRDGNYSDGFVNNYLVPMGSAIWSVPANKVLEMPTDFFVRFFHNHGMLTVNDRPEWRVIKGGSKRYVEKLIAQFADRIRLGTPVHSIERHEDRVVVNGEVFDHTVLACHSDQVLALLSDATPIERELLGALPYQKNEVVLHTDTSLLPRARAAWAAWNYRIGEEVDAPVQLTYDMNILQSLQAPQTFCVSLNATDKIEPSKILFQVSYDHPVYTLDGIDAQQRHGEISGIDRTHFCGAYWGNGFHEDGVNSALAVGKAFGVSL